MSKFDKLAITLVEACAPEGTRYKSRYEVGDRVKGPFGDALITKFNDETGDCILQQLEYWDEEIKPGYKFRSNGFELFGHAFDDEPKPRLRPTIRGGRINPKWSKAWDRGQLGEAMDLPPLVTPAWIVSQTYLPDTVVEVVKLEHERKARRYKSAEEAMKQLTVGNVVVIPDPANPKDLKIHFANWDSS